MVCHRPFSTLIAHQKSAPEGAVLRDEAREQQRGGEAIEKQSESEQGPRAFAANAPTNPGRGEPCITYAYPDDGVRDRANGHTGTRHHRKGRAPAESRELMSDLSAIPKHLTHEKRRADGSSAPASQPAGRYHMYNPACRAVSQASKRPVSQAIAPFFMVSLCIQHSECSIQHPSIRLGCYSPPISLYSARASEASLIPEAQSGPPREQAAAAVPRRRASRRSQSPCAP